MTKPASKILQSKQRIQSHYAVFGRVILERGICTICNEQSFIQDNRFILCDHLVNSTVSTIQVESSFDSFLILDKKGKIINKRKTPSSYEKLQILKKQNNKCIYCENDFNNKIRYKNKLIVLKLHWDHFVPYSLSYNNDTSNFYASCHICNLIKRNKLFATLQEAIEYVQAKRTRNTSTDLSNLPERIYNKKEEPNILSSKLQTEDVRLKSSALQKTLASILRISLEYHKKTIPLLNFYKSIKY